MMPKTTTVTQKHSQTTRPDLRLRMSSRRRLPHPNASTTSTPAAQEGTSQQQHVMLTYSEFLRNFDTVPVSFNGDYRHRPSFAISPFGETPDEPEAGPSNAHSGFYPSDDRQDFFVVVENERMRDGFEDDQMVEHGKIEEVESDERLGNTVQSDEELEEDFATPRARTKSTLFPSSSILNGRTGDQDTERGSRRSRRESLPLTSTPPAQRLKNLPSVRSLKETATTSDYHSLKATSIVTPLMPQPANIAGSSSVLDHGTEVSLVGKIIESLALAQEDCRFMSTYFLAKSRGLEKELSQHIDLCSRMEESLASLRASMNLRTQIGAEEWAVKSASWFQKYCRRLLSLQTTLERLSRVRGTVETTPPRPRQRAAILTKLEQHEAKLADLASKYTVAFDRLRLRHLHFLLTQSHEEAKLHKDLKKSKLLSKASFERRWREGKTLRSTLRGNFHDLRQEFYNNAERHPPHPSAP